MDFLEQIEYKKMIKAVRFDYYQIYLKVLDGDHFVEHLLDINSLLEFAQGISPANRMCFINGSDEVRLQDLNLTCLSGDQINIWELQVIRLRAGILSGIAKDTGEFGDIELEEDEGLGEDIAIIFDPCLYLLAVQRNRNSITPTGFAEYIQTFFEEYLPDKSKVFLKPIPNKRLFHKYNSDRLYRKLTFDFTKINLNQIDEQQRSSALIELSKVQRQFPGIHFKIEMSVGRSAKKTDSMNREEIEKMIDNLRTQDSNNTLRVAYKEDEDCKVEYFDLIEEREYDVETFEYTRKEPIRHNEIKSALKNIYLRRRSHFYNLLRDQINE